MHTETPYTIFVRLSRALALLAGLISLVASVAAQPSQSLIDELGGSYYLIAFPDTTINDLDSRYPNTRVRPEASIWIYSAVKNKVRITNRGGFSTTLVLEANKFKSYQIPIGAVVDQINTPVMKSFKVEADYPVILYCYFAHIQGLEAWTPLPVEFWGGSYRAAAAAGEVVLDVGIAGETEIPEKPKPGPAEILVIAAYDSTTVTLTPPRGIGFAGNGANVVMLREGECYQVQSVVNVYPDTGQQDIGATKIEADKPVGVISGNTRAQFLHDKVGLKNNAYKNLAIEWLRPEEQYGTEFVYMPTYDNHRPGIGAAAERRKEYVRLYPKDAATLHGSYIARDSGSQVVRTTEFEIARDTLREFSFLPNDAVHFTTDRPAQAMMHSSAIVQFNGSTPCFRGIPCLSYSAWAPYMVALTPREQWTTFAPYYAPPNPGGMQHYINVVTDTNSVNRIVRENGTTFLFNRKIPGTDLIWGSMSVSQGEDHWLMGKDSARFAGYLYGVFQGGEEYRPGRARKKDGDAIASGGGHADAPAPLHPAEYEEYNALSYGYPLLSMSRVVRPSDNVEVDTIRGCSSVTIKARAVNLNPVGFRSAVIDPQSNVNAKLVPVDPDRFSDIIGRSAIELMVAPIDPRKRASAVVVIRDRSGNVWRVPVVIEAVALSITGGDAVRFDSVAFNLATNRIVTITNQSVDSITVNAIDLAIDGQGFTIISTNPDGPARPTPAPVVLAPGEPINVMLRFLPSIPGVAEPYLDSLVISYECHRLALPISGIAPEPEIVAEDLDFGSMTESAGPRTLWVRVCNVGPGWAAFTNPSGGPLLEWSGGAFSVPDTAIAWLQNMVLRRGQCASLPVTFTPQGKGDYQTTARFRVNTRNSRDTSIWRARVTGSSGGTGMNRIAGYTLETSAHGEMIRITYTLAKRAGVRVDIHDGVGAHVARLIDEGADAGENALFWNAGAYPSGIYICTITTAEWSGSAPIIIVR